MISEEMKQKASSLLVDDLKRHGSNSERIPMSGKGDPYKVGYRTLALIHCTYYTDIFNDEYASLEDCYEICRLAHSYYEDVIFSDSRELSGFECSYGFIRGAWDDNWAD